MTRALIPVRRLRRRLGCGAMVVVLPFLTSGCGPSVQVQLGMKNVPLNIAVGNDTAVKPPRQGGPAPAPVAEALPAFAPPTITSAPSTAPTIYTGFVPPAPSASADLCPAMDPTKPSPAAATPEVDGTAVDGVWKFASTGAYSFNGVATSMPTYNFRVVSGAAQTGQGQFGFTQQGVALGFVNAPSTYVASNSTSAPANPVAAPTSFFGLSGIAISTPSGAVIFQPPKPLTLLSTPAQAYGPYQPDPNNPAIPNSTGQWSDAQTDAQHGTTMSIQATDLGHVRVNACGTPVDAWQVQATITITGSEVWTVTPSPAKTDVTLSVTYAVATGLGGMIVAEKVQTQPNADSTPATLGGASYSTSTASTIASPKPEAS